MRVIITSQKKNLKNKKNLSKDFHHFQNTLFSNQKISFKKKRLLNKKPISNQQGNFRSYYTDVNLIQDPMLQQNYEKHKHLNAFTEFSPRTLKSNKNKSKQDLPFSEKKIAIKDNFLVEGFKTTCASKTLENFNSPYTSTLCKKIFDKGGIILGKTNLDEFAMGSTSITSIFGPTLNPHCPKFSKGKDNKQNKDEDKEIFVAGGSSSGSAVAVATGIADMALGSDTGGSVRQPASWCGIVGFKPSYGRLSRYGLVSFASSFDTPGLFTKNVKDSAFFFEELQGHDPNDSTSLCKKDDFKNPLKHIEKNQTNLKGITIGIPKEYYIEELDPDTLLMWKESIEKLKILGANIIQVSLPNTKIALSTYYTLVTAEAYSNLARYDGIRFGLTAENNDHDIINFYEKNRSEGFGNEVQRRILLGSFVLSRNSYNSYYKKAQQCRRLIKDDFTNLFQKQNIQGLVFPTTPFPALSLAEISKFSPIDFYSADLMTVSSNLSGIPSISIPFGNSKKFNLPLGIQVVTDFLDEERMFQIAFALEK